MTRPVSLARAGPVLAALVLCPSGILAQAGGDGRVDVVGHVVQEWTGEPVDGALVTVEGHRGGGVTDSTGAFALDDIPPGFHRFRIERLGFWTTVFPTEISGPASLLFRVDLNLIVAERIEVVLDVLKDRRNAVPFAVRTYGPERLAGHIDVDLEEFLRRRAGLHLVPCRTRPSRFFVPGPPSCLPHRGRALSPSVWIDESRVAGGLDAAFGYDIAEIHSIEVVRGCGMIRVYTRRFMEALATGRRSLYPVIPECTG